MTVPSDLWVLPRPRPDAYPGSFPLHFEKRLWRLLGEPQRVLHPFGGLAEIGDSIDLNETTLPTFVGNAHDLANLKMRDGRPHSIGDETYDLVILDPPYSNEESELIYGTPALSPKLYIAEALRVCKTGGHVAIYHVRQPMRPKGTKLVHRVVVIGRPNHTARICFVFEKLPKEES